MPAWPRSNSYSINGPGEAWASEHFTNLVLIIEYEGTRYRGFQVQAHEPTVQQELEQAVMRLTGETVRVLCASRTDTGVHAKGQVVSFRTEAKYPPRVFVNALNYYLPDDIAVREAHRMSLEFHVRRDASSRVYRYSLLTRKTRSPLLRNTTYWIPRPLDIERMREAARLLVGEHDFAAFAGVLDDPKASTRRTLYRAEMKVGCELMEFEVEGNAFLPQQIRRTVGELVEVGLDRVPVGEFERLVECGRPHEAGPALPPQGLCLERVNYQDFPPKVERDLERVRE